MLKDLLFRCEKQKTQMWLRGDREKGRPHDPKFGLLSWHGRLQAGQAHGLDFELYQLEGHTSLGEICVGCANSDCT